MLKKIINYAVSILSIILGIIFIFGFGISLSSITYYFGVFLIVFALLNLILSLLNTNFQIKFGSSSFFVNIIGGFLLIIFKDAALNWISYLIGSYLLIYALFNLTVNSFLLNFKGKERFIFRNILYIIIGVTVILVPSIPLIVMRIALGVILIIFGIYVFIFLLKVKDVYKVKVK